MVHLRARNLPAKGKIIEWTFSEGKTSFGEDFAVIETEDGKKINIKSNCDGLIVRTVKLGSQVKNGSILANIAIDEKEKLKYKNKYLKDSEKDIIVEDIYLPDYADDINFQEAEQDADSFSGAVVYDRNNRAVTPFSTGEEDIMDSEQKFKKIVEKDSTIMDKSEKKLDRFAQMRANISASIANSPQKKTLGDLDREDLLKETNESAGPNLFSNDNSEGVSKFRKLVEVRKNKLLNENNYKESENMGKHIDAMSKLDDKGRPLIMRNIIQNRMEKLIKSGGDPNALQRESVIATKENAILDNEKTETVDFEVMESEKNHSNNLDYNNINIEKNTKNEEIKMQNGAKKSLLKVKREEVFNQENNNVSQQNTNSNLAFDKQKMLTKHQTEDDVFMRQAGSVDGQFGVSFGGYVESSDDEDNVIDANDVMGTYGTVIMPKKDSQSLVNEIQNKDRKSYAEQKITNLYDNDKRLRILQSRTAQDEIAKRRAAFENVSLNKRNDTNYSTKSNIIEIPKMYFESQPFQNPSSGEITYVPFKDTPQGKVEFEKWLTDTGNFKDYYSGKKEISLVESLGNSNEKDKWKNQNEFNGREIKPLPGIQKNRFVKDYDEYSSHRALRKTEAQINIDNMKSQELFANPNSIPNPNTTIGNEFLDKETLPKEIENQKQLIKLLLEEKAAKKEVDSNEEIKYLKKTIEDLKNDLDKSNKLQDATNSLNQKSGGLFNTNSSDMFSQMMQYTLMQNMISSMSQNNRPLENNQENIRNLIEKQISDFLGSLNPSGDKNFSNIKEKVVDKKDNFLKDKPDDMLAYLNVDVDNESDNREQVNNFRNPAVKSMILSQSYIPPLTISTEVDMTSILKLKHVLKKNQNKVIFTTIAFVAKAISLALEEYPRLNSSYDPESNEIIIKKYHNIGLATETNEGLVIPVLKFIDKLSVKEVAIDIKEVTERLRSGELFRYETSGSTITLANYGNVGAIQATPTIFYPNAAVIGVGKVVKRPMVVDNDNLTIKAIMNISLTVDQRIIDASEAGNFLNELKNILEYPELLTVS